MTNFSRAQVAAMVDHTLLKPEATADDVAALARTEPPRGAAIAAIAGIAAIVVAAWIDPTPFQVHDLGLAWQRLFSGEIRA